MDRNQILIILKYAGSTITAVYGVYATLTDFKEEKSGKKVLSRKGYLGIALLLVSAIFSLSTSALEDYKDARDAEARAAEEAKKRSEDLARIEGITSDLKTVRLQLQGAQTSLESTFGKTKEISGDLSVQLALSDIMSKRLTGAAETLLDTSKTTSSLLRENIENIGFIDVVLELKINPKALKDESGRSILSSDLLAGLEDGTADRDEILKQLKARSSLIRTLAGQEMTLISYLGKEAGERKSWGLFPNIIKQTEVFSGNDRMSYFVLADNSILDDSDEDITCLLTYRSLANRFSGVRKFNDLNGLIWGVFLKMQSAIFRPRGLMLDVGQGNLFERKRFLLLTPEGLSVSGTQVVRAKLRGGKDEFHGELIIPDNFF